VPPTFTSRNASSGALGATSAAACTMAWTPPAARAQAAGSVTSPAIAVAPSASTAGRGGRAHQRAHHVAPSDQRGDHVAADHAAAARDENRHAGSRRLSAKGSASTRASVPRRAPCLPGPPHAAVYRGRSSGRWETCRRRHPGDAGHTADVLVAMHHGRRGPCVGLSVELQALSSRFGCPRKCRRLTVSWPV